MHFSNLKRSVRSGGRSAFPAGAECLNGAAENPNPEHRVHCGGPSGAYLDLTGVWLAMYGELCFRGLLFLIRLLRGKWLVQKVRI